MCETQYWILCITRSHIFFFVLGFRVRYLFCTVFSLNTFPSPYWRDGRAQFNGAVAQKWQLWRDPKVHYEAISISTVQLVMVSKHKQQHIHAPEHAHRRVPGGTGGLHGYVSLAHHFEKLYSTGWLMNWFHSRATFDEKASLDITLRQFKV